jgi:polyphosphate kinase
MRSCRSHVPVTPPAFAIGVDGPADLFAAIRERDVLVHHPYESFSDSTEAFLAQAADDPAVLAIKHTLYRTSGVENTIVRNLIEAAEAGKQVVTLVELTARFDEQANIKLARVLEEAGVHVVYGVVGLKSHCKVTLVVRAEADGIRRYVHIGTGNYHPQTARSYEDLGLFSSVLCARLRTPRSCSTISPAAASRRRIASCSSPPGSLRATLLEEIERERTRGRAGRIAIKVNGLADGPLIDALYAASDAGVEIDLVVRGVCCLRPGVPGLSESIRRALDRRARSSSTRASTGSATAARRVTTSAPRTSCRATSRAASRWSCPVEAPPLAARIDEILDLCLADDVLAWQLDGRARGSARLGTSVSPRRKSSCGARRSAETPKQTRLGRCHA